MKHLTELKSIITRHKIKRINILQGRKVRPAKTLLAKFYNALMDDKIQNDEEAARFLYKTSPSDHRYKLLKITLKERMINTLFFIDVKRDKFSTRRHAEITCYRYLVAINILKHFGAYKIIINLAEKILREAEKYELTLPSLSVLNLLCNYHAAIQGNHKKFLLYQAKFDKMIRRYQIEATLKREYYNIISIYVNKKSNYKEFTQQARKKIPKIKSLLKEEKSIESIYHGNMCLLVAFSGTKHIDRRIQLCEEVLAELEKKPFVKTTTTLLFLINLSLFYTAKKDYKKGEGSIKKATTLTQKGSFNWFKIQELYFMLCMHTERYEKADQILQEVLSTKQFKKTPDHIQELWIINQAYIYLLKETNMLPQNLKKHHSFKVAKFFNEVPVFSKDKRGINVSILVIQYIFWLNRGKTAQIIDRVESLKQYTYKHLRDPHLKRSNLFLKILCTIPNAQFHPELIHRKTLKWQQQLFNTPLDLNDQPFEIEIIPYEKLWEIIQKIISEKQLTLYRSQKRQRK